MTPRELALCADGYQWRTTREREERAYWTALMLKPWGFTGEPKDLMPVPAQQNEAAFERLAGMS